MSSESPSVTRQQAHAIAQLLRSVRPAWDELVTTNAVAEASKTHRDLADLAYGCVVIAQSTDAQTPAALGHQNRWRVTVRETETPADVAARKQAQLDAAVERERERRQMTDEERAERATRLVAQARAAIRPCKAPVLQESK